MSDTTVTTEAPPPAANTPEARTPDGTLKSVTESTTPSETKTTETKPEAETKVEGAPEVYADFKLPEGFKANSEALKSVSATFKELNLTQDQAQKLVDAYTSNLIDVMKGPEEAYNTIREGWRKEVLSDATLATGGKMKPEVLQTIGRAIDSIGDAKVSQSFREIMDTTGVGDNPAFVKMFYHLAKASTEGTHVNGNGPSPGGQSHPNAKPTSIANAMFPNLK